MDSASSRYLELYRAFEKGFDVHSMASDWAEIDLGLLFPPKPAPPNIDLTALFSRRTRYLSRIANLDRAVKRCLSADGRLSDLVKAAAYARKELAIDDDQLVSATADYKFGEFPPREVELEYRTLVQAVGAQQPLGAWSVLQFDLLNAYRDQEHMLTDIFPSIVANHPSTSLNAELSDSDLIRYQGFFKEAAQYLRRRAADTEARYKSSGNAQASAAASLRGAWQALASAYTIYTTLEYFVDKSLEVVRKNLDAQRKKAELDAVRKEHVEKIRAMQQAEPIPDADRWLDQKPKYDQWKNTA